MPSIFRVSIQTVLVFSIKRAVRRVVLLTKRTYFLQLFFFANVSEFVL